MGKGEKISIAILLIITIIVGLLYSLGKKEKDNQIQNEAQVVENTSQSAKVQPKKSEYQLEEGISKFDISFLQFENENQQNNMIYSPLSIKYALKMLEEGSNGKTKEQISSILSDYAIKNYSNNKNMAFGNALFVRDNYKIKDEYISKLQSQYNAEVIKDPFKSANTINTWISGKTLNLINNIVSDEEVQNNNFMLVNALGIDMEWKNKFLEGMTEEDNSQAIQSTETTNTENNIASNTADTEQDLHIKETCDYAHENADKWSIPVSVEEGNFENSDKSISRMRINASINNYDIITELGEENIRNDVEEAFRIWANEEPPTDSRAVDTSYKFEDEYPDKTIDEAVEEYLDGYTNEYGTYIDGYMDGLKANYKDVSYTTDFSIYVDDNVKMFAKDLKEYDGTTLQYIGIMPTQETLDDFVKSTSAKDIKKMIGNLKELKSENFKQGVLTEITGYIPKFKFDYDLNLINDLKKMGVEDVFTQGKANLSNMCYNPNAYIGNMAHKSTIEFTQDGIKASAATMVGGSGAGDTFDYIYDIPIEKIDLTFDKPYMFLIRDKQNGEIWFVGNVYNPLTWEEDQTKLQ